MVLTFEKTRGSETSVILGLRHEVEKHCALLGYAASSGSSLPTFRDIPVGPILKGQPFYRTDRLFRNVGKVLPLLAAQ